MSHRKSRGALRGRQLESRTLCPPRQPIGATGLAQIFEIVTQLRGEAGSRQVEAARFGIQENGGGLWGCEEALAHVGILGRD
jgi:hypothetical protein